VNRKTDRPRYLIICALLILLPAPVLASRLDIHILDVGEGQAVLLHQQQDAILIDTGHAGHSAGVLRKMASLGIKRLDTLILTHLHPDHASGYFRIHEAYPAARVLSNCHPVQTTQFLDMSRWVDEALQANPRHRCIRRGYTQTWLDSRIEALWPNQIPANEHNLNRYSLVLQIEHAGKRLLIMGDADKTSEGELLKLSTPEAVDILVVGHHGAADASSEDWLRAVRPKTAVVSINRDNKRHYPAAETLQRVQRMSESLFTTAESGDLHFVFE
jgi:competence protein ComEC